MAMEPLTLIVNPGSASRKYILFAGDEPRASLHFEYVGEHIICTLLKGSEAKEITVDVHDLKEAIRQVLEVFRSQEILHDGEEIGQLGLRIVAPSSFFLEDRVIDNEVVDRLEAVRPHAPLHIEATLTELKVLREVFPETRIVGLSDSAFHITKPDYAWNYGLPLRDSDQFDVKRYGYHGLSVASAVYTLNCIGKLPPKLIVCHIGSGVSVTAVHGGRSVDTTMGYSPLEGVVMATRSGNVDYGALRVLKESLDFDDVQLEAYLNHESGLLGLGGSSDIRELLYREANGDHYAQLALQTYIYALQKAVGQMAAVLNGADMLVFTATVGERSAPIRRRILEKLHFLDFILDEQENERCVSPTSPVCISRLAHSRPVFVVPAGESAEMLRRMQLL